MIKVIKFIEKMWLMLAVITFLIGVYRAIQYSVFDALYFLGFSVVSIFLFSIRRKQRRYHERNNKS